MEWDKLDEDKLNQALAALEEASKSIAREYVPHAKQKSFHCAPHKIRGVFGGNRSGKTEMGALEARFHATGQYPEWYPLEGRFSGPTRGRIIVTDYKKGSNEVLEPKIEHWFDPACIIKTERFLGHIIKLFIKHIAGGTSTIDIMTHEQDSMAFEGWAGHWAWFDEPPPREKFVATQRGLVDFNGRCWLTLTPISEPWLYDEIVGKASDRVWFTTIDIRDNPYLSEQAIKDFEATLMPEEKEARIHGKFIHLAGRVYKDFDPDIHCLVKMPKGWEDWPTWFVLDPADRRPHHGIWAKVDPMDNIYIFDELVYKGTIADTCKEILVREKMRGINPDHVIRILDPNKGNTPTAATGLKLVEEFAKDGNNIYFTATVNDDLALGHLAVAEKLGYDKTKLRDGLNHPKLMFIADSTRECVKQLLSYVWDDWRGDIKGSRSQKEKPKDINKDMPDAIRYLVMSGPTWYYDEETPRGFSGGRTGYGP